MLKLTTENFVTRSIAKHGSRYDYSKVSYATSRTKVCIICPVHGEFFQTPDNHLAGEGCILCGFLRTSDQCRHTTGIFVKKANSVHENSYDYSKVDYKNARTKVCIVCPIHGEFFQAPDKHLSGHQCPRCVGSKGEKAITKWLQKKGIPFHHHHPCHVLRVGGKRPLHFDFCTKHIKYLIEYDGEQHFNPVRFNNVSKEQAVEVFKKTQYHDSLKNQYCIENNIPLLRISYKEFDHIPEILFSKLQTGVACQKLFVNEMTLEELSRYYTENV